MYRLVYCDANANALSVAAARGPTLRLLGFFSPLQLTTEGCLFGVEGGDRAGLSGAQP